MKRRPVTPETKPEVLKCPVVALGASAGGLEVFARFFELVPANSGVAFVLVQHLDPRHETLMPELLAPHTDMPVLRVSDGLQMRANHVYVIPPNVGLELNSCGFRLTPLPARSERKVIDQFFRSVAEDQGESAVGVVLTGTGSDGTLGLKAIKEHGGLTIAQLPASAKFDSMPQSAIAAGNVDVVLPIEEIPDRILDHIRYLNRLHNRKGAETIQREALKHLPKIFSALRKKTGQDFSLYKRSTVIRRIQRRMQIMYLDSVAKYVQKLNNTPEEVDALFKDLLIGVTQFFRDPGSFEVIAKKVIPAIFQEKRREPAIRVWVPGCASGEEAYTLAILISEHAATCASRPRIQIFATDLDVDALEFARRGIYAEDIAQQVSPERLHRFFRKVPGGYEVVDEIRELCIFSPHNLIKDPPFSRLDLISCRNLLIYLEADLQKKLLPLFHYALNPCGYLFLGPSENIASRSELFRLIDPKHRLFQRKPSLLNSSSGQLPVIDPGRVTRLQLSSTSSSSVPKEQNLSRSIERMILEEYAPASAVINEHAEVLYFSGNTGKYLAPTSGVPSNKIVAMAHKDLRLELRTAIHRAVSTHKEVARRNVTLRVGRRREQLDLIVRPLIELGKELDLYIVLFRQVPATKVSKRSVPQKFIDPEHPVIKQLENELRDTKEDLQTTIEELETSNEELKSANEELLSMNEELQSANEELQTSKEEIQSANDELQRKIEEADAANAELRRSHEERARFASIVQNSDDAIIGKTLEGIVTSWNAAAEHIFGFTPKDMIGQSIKKIIPPELHHEEDMILARLRQGLSVQHYETERVTKSGRRIFISLTSSPIRDQQGFIIGAAKIARDITVRRQADELRNRLAAIVESSDDAIISKNLDGVITTWNKGAEIMYGYTAEEVIGQPITILIPAERVDEEPAIMERLKRGEKIEHYETVRRRKDGTLMDVSLTVSPVKDSTGKIIGASKIARDVTLQKQMERALQESKTQLEQKVAERTASLRETTQQLETFCYTIAHDLRSPLRGQQSFAQILLEDYGESIDAKGKTYLERIVASARRLDTLIVDLLAYSRLAREDLKFDRVDLKAVVKDVEDQLSEQINSAHGVVTIGKLHAIKGHPATINLLVTNLVTNALKFVRDGVPPRVKVFSEHHGDFVRLWVEDNGIGIQAENVQKIFGIFQRLHSANAYPGTGIGLAIVQKGVERMNGRVGVESVFGEGSRFWIELPAATN